MEIYIRKPIRRKQILLLAVDVILLFAAFTISYVLRVGWYEGMPLWTLWERVSMLLVPGIFIHVLIFYVFELYDVSTTRPDANLFLRILLAGSVGGCLVALISFSAPQYRMGRLLVVMYLPAVIILVFLWRKLFFTHLLRKGVSRNLVFFQAGKLVPEIIRSLKSLMKLEYELVGSISSQDGSSILLNGTISYPDIPTLVKEKQIGSIVLPEDLRAQPGILRQLIGLKFAGVEIFDFPTFYQKVLGKTPVPYLEDSWFLFAGQNRSYQPFFYLKIKRLFDVIASLIGLIILFPAILVVSLSIKMTSKGPVFFRQERLGLNEVPFTLVKFRTMEVNAEAGSGPRWASENDPRITKVGRILRKSRLDEIPQLVNVLKGEMSFVGPRPIRKHFADLLAEQSPFYRLRFTAKPGLTGWAQSMGDYAGSMEGQMIKLEYDLFYILNRSLFMDLFIILKTFQTVLFRRGN